VEFDALHRPWQQVQEDSTFPPAPVTTLSTTKVDGTLWDFPVMVNYRFLSSTVRPYAGGGLLLLRHASATEQMTRTPGTSPPTIPPTIVIRFSGDNWFPSYTAQAGLEWKHAHFVIRPEARYSYWRQLSTSVLPIIVQRNQVEFLVGFAFEPNKNK
jgi:hypothetical protein